MNRSEAYTLIKAKVRRFCEASLEPSDGAARKLVWELNAIVDEVNTDSGPTLAGMKKTAIDSLFETGLLVRKCRHCVKPIVDCRCNHKHGTKLELDRDVLRRLESI